MTNYSPRQTMRGFSLIEVLVAVVILSVGLLALASLQISLIRSSTETKAQSAAMALAKEKLEQLASYRSLGGADSSCTSPTSGGSNTCYRAITSEAMAAIDIDPVTAGAQSTVGGVDYQRGTTVTRYVFDKAAASAPAYYAVGNTLTDASVKALTGHTYLPGKEFKRVVVTVRWNDANGNQQSVVVEDALSGIDPGDTIALSKNKGSGAARKAVAIITNPASIAGVIPIAVGNGSDTAATNPRPVLLAQGGNTTLVETRFDIYTYAALTNSTARAQSRVETSVVGCKCVTGGGTQTANRPTFWDGYRYVAPDSVTGIPVSSPKAGVDQSALCTSCCRDHFDPSGVTGPKFDPRRATHNHYLASDIISNGNSATPVDMATAGNDYNEACRLIRVDGIFRVATEPYDDHYGLVATAGLNQSTPTTTIAGAVPASGSGSTTEAYQNYVLGYLDARFVSGSESGYNTPLDPSTVTGYSTLQAPAKAYISVTSSPQYLHGRGLFVDYLTDDVKTLITNAKLPANCKGTDGLPADTTAEFQSCVLRLLPFTSINLTELADWTSSAPTKVVIANNLFKTSITDQFPIKGKATLGGGATNGDQSTGTGLIQRTSAGLAVVNKVFPDSELEDATTGLPDNMLSDVQLFEIGAGVVGPPSNETFSVNLVGSDLFTVIDLNNAAEVNFTIGTTTACNKNGVTIVPYTCVPAAGQALGGSVTVNVGNYNRASTKAVQNSCTQGTNNQDDTTPMPIRKVFDVSSASVTGGGSATPLSSINNNAIGSIAAGGEYTPIVVNPLSDTNVVTVNFSNVSYLCPSNYSDYISNNGNEASPLPVNNGSGSICSTGNPKTPLWSSTYVACPGALSFP